MLFLATFSYLADPPPAVILTSPLIRDYLLNYARSLIYTTSLSFANIVAADSSFDMLMDGTAQQVIPVPLIFSLHLTFAQLSKKVLDLSRYFVEELRQRLRDVPLKLLSLPVDLQRSSLSSPIIPIMTTRPRPLSAHLLTLGMNARPITWPTVPKGKDRVRVCLHAGNTRSDVDRLIEGMMQWVEGEQVAEICAAKDGEHVVQSKL